MKPFVVAVLAVALCACANEPADQIGSAINPDRDTQAANAATPRPEHPRPPVPAASSTPRLIKTAWIVTAINGRSTPAGPGYQLAFDRYGPGGITAGFGCNNFQGFYTLNGDHLSTRDLVGTEMACGDPVKTFERQGAAILASNMRIEHVSQATLRLVSEVGSIDLQRAN